MLPMPSWYIHRLTVSRDAIDHLGHANNAVYLVWLQEAAIAHSAANDWPVARYQEINAGWIARAHTIEYLAPAFAGDEVLVQTWVSGVRKVVSSRRYRLYRESDQVLLGTAETKWAFVDFGTFRPKRVPAGFWTDFEVLDEAPEMTFEAGSSE